jgi:repressor LexA
LVGSVAAGSPILAVENVQGRVPMAASMFDPKADYLLRVRGNSMTDIGILDGDLLAVHKTADARSGQVVVARLDDEVTVKRLHRHRGGRVELLPENKDYEPIAVEGREFAIEGIAVGLIRNGSRM